MPFDGTLVFTIYREAMPPRACHPRAPLACAA